MLPIVRRLLRPAAGAMRMGAVATVPIHTTAAILDSPRAARADAASQRLDALRHEGWRPVEVRTGHRRTEVHLERGGERRTVTGDTLAFAAYATVMGERSRTPVHHTA